MKTLDGVWLKIIDNFSARTQENLREHQTNFFPNRQTLKSFFFFLKKKRLDTHKSLWGGNDINVKHESLHTVCVCSTWKCKGGIKYLKKKKKNKKGSCVMSAAASCVSQ